MLVLSIETSCDDTSVAIVCERGKVLALESQNQDEIHGQFGGVIPELACRNHTLRILPLVDSVLQSAKINWQQIDGIAVTSQPGLVGALLVGVSTAKSLALIHGKPIIGVDHLEGHLHAPLAQWKDYRPDPDFTYPFLGLCVSGGHTSLYEVQDLGKRKVLGQTLDDAAGEAFDKFGKLMGLGYPAGAHLDKLASDGDVKKYEFPRALLKDKKDLNFSFSGLKTAGRLTLEKHAEANKKDLAASYQEAIVDVLVEKLDRAFKQTSIPRVVITGGVSANSRLRMRCQEWAQEKGLQLLVPPLALCTDNAGMIGYVGLKMLERGWTSDMTLAPSPSTKLGLHAQ